MRPHARERRLPVEEALLGRHLPRLGQQQPEPLGLPAARCHFDLARRDVDRIAETALEVDPQGLLVGAVPQLQPIEGLDQTQKGV